MEKNLQKWGKVAPPSVRKLAREKNVDLSNVTGTGPGGLVNKSDLILYLERRAGEGGAEKPAEEKKKPEQKAEKTKEKAEDKITRKKMTPIRKRISERLLEAKHSTAMLTTFNDVDMSRVMDIRNRYKKEFEKKYDVRLGFMSFFIKASVEALKEFPEINAYIEGEEIVYHHYYNVGVAIGTKRGLVVPVIRDADKLGFAEIEKAILAFVDKTKDNTLSLSDMEGGTFTITNGGVYGSLLSTPILNTPQSGILGMHRIEERPVVIDGEIVIRPMMYLAVSYDHRIVDGREAVSFLRRIKEFIENPERMMMEI